MGREIKRVPLDFDWPLQKIWEGFLEPQRYGCVQCAGKLVNPDCRECDGNGYRSEYTEPPVGAGYQVWETVSEGSPVSPVFEYETQLIDWLILQGYSAVGASEFVRLGWTFSAMFTPQHGFQNGIDALANLDD